MNARSEKYLAYAGLGLMALLIGSYAFLAAFIAYDVPQADYWEWMHKLLIPYLNGDIDLLAYMSGAFKPFTHSHIPTLLFQLLNYGIFDLRYDVEYYFGLLCVVLLYFYLLRRYYGTAKHVLDGRSLVVCTCALTAILLNPFTITTNGLVQFEFFYLLLAVVFMAAYDDLLRSRIGPVTFYLFTFVMFFVGDAMGTVAIFSVLAHLILVAPFRDKVRHIAGISAALLLGYLIAEPLFTYVGPVSVDKISAIPYVLSHKLDSLVLILNGYSQGIVDQHSIVRRVFVDSFNVVALMMGAVTLALSFGAFCLYFVHRERFPTALPVLLIFFSGIIVVGILLSRFPLEGPMYSLNDRYQRQSVLGVFGAFWIYSLLFLSHRTGNPHFSAGTHRIGEMLILLASVTTVSVGLLSNTLRWSMIGQERERLDIVAGGIVAFTGNPEIDIYKYVYNRHCYSDDCIRAVYFLKDRELSVFRPTHVIYRENVPDRDYISQDSFFAPYDREEAHQRLQEWQNLPQK